MLNGGSEVIAAVGACTHTHTHPRLRRAETIGSTIGKNASIFLMKCMVLLIQMYFY